MKLKSGWFGIRTMIPEFGYVKIVSARVLVEEALIN